MATLKTKDIDISLQKKGFQRYETDHSYYRFYYNGKRTSISTKISHGEKEIGDKLIAMMSKQLRISKSEMIELINCTLSRQQYEQLLLDKDIIN